jgi:Ras-related protein Rab-5C
MILSGQIVRTAKVVLLGYQTVGKTSLVNRFIHNSFQGTACSTIGAVFVTKTLNFNEVQVKLEIWDTGGQEKYRSLAPLYYRDAQAALLIYDITSQESFKVLLECHRDLLEKRGNQPMVVAVAGNKKDLLQMRAVNKAAVDSFGETNRIAVVMETSALTGEGVLELFENIAKTVLEGTTAGGGASVLRSEKPEEVAENGCKC